MSAVDKLDYFSISVQRSNCFQTYPVTRYWIMGNCLAGNTCVFSHDPSKFMNKMSLDENGQGQENIQVQDLNSFPALQSGGPDQANNFTGAGASLIAAGLNPPQGPRHFHGSESPRLRSRPGSRHQVKDNNVGAPAIDDNEAFPSLGSASAKQGKKHHGKRGGHGHAHKENIPNSLADIVKMTPSPTPGSPRPESRRLANGAVSAKKTDENSAAAQAIPSPKHIPWLETGDGANKAYLKARQEAIKHGGLRNKFLQRYVLYETWSGEVFGIVTTSDFLSARLRLGIETMPGLPRL